MRTAYFLIFCAATAAAWAQTTPPGCASFPNCLYASPVNGTFTGSAASVTYRDAAGDNRAVNLFVRVPNGLTGALPVVIWSHGEAVTGDAQTRMQNWAEATARAGYITITVAHPLRDVSRATDICARLRLEDEQCFAIGLTNWDWPNDLKETLNWLERVNTTADSPLRGRVDMRRIAVAGHNDGSNAAISLAGAKRLLTTLDRKKANDFSDPRPAAFVSLSPQGPLLDGFYDLDLLQPNHSWQGVARPVFTATSWGDNTCSNFPGQCTKGSTPGRRIVAYDLLPECNKYLLFLRDSKASNDLIGSLQTSRCESAGVEAALCTRMADWLRASVLAFLDGHLREREAARIWLREGLIARASNGEAEGRSK